jgi:hypothetical protein
LKNDICPDTQNFINERGALPIFYMRIGKLMRLATCFVLVAGFVPRIRIFKALVERRGINWQIEKICLVMMHFITCWTGSRIVPDFPCIFANGRAVWLVAVRVRAGGVFARPDRWPKVVSSR